MIGYVFAPQADNRFLSCSAAGDIRRILIETHHRIP